MKTYHLKCAQSGFAAGKALVLSNNTHTQLTDSDSIQDIPQEIASLDNAVASLKEKLSSFNTQGATNSKSIMKAELMLLNDEQFIPEAKRIITETKCKATSALKMAADNLSRILRNSDSAYIQERAADIWGLANQLIDSISGKEFTSLTSPAILVARELSPAELSSFDTSLIQGLVTYQGAPNSHVSIIAGELDIPYLYGNEELIDTIQSEDCIIIEKELLFLNPEESEWSIALERYDKEQLQKQEEVRKIEELSTTLPTKTKVYANVGKAEEAQALISSGAEGVGLFRSEFLFLHSTNAPTEEEQFNAYKTIVQAMGNKETIIRTMDIGSDKSVEWLNLPQEKNPALGCRGLRVSLEKPEIFKIQLRALMRAAHFGNLKIMVPMVASLWEVDAVQKELKTCAEELSTEGIPYTIPPLGIMIETPSAVILADKFAEKVDFFSIGTNDLTQYSLAIDREAQNLDNYFNPRHEALFRMIDTTVQSAHNAGISVGICGELGSNPEAIERLVQIGVDELSVSIGKVRRTKALVVSAEEKLFKKETLNKETNSDISSTSSKGFNITAPADGVLIPMKDIPDEAFSSGLLGDCIGIIPENGTIYAPSDGTVTSIAESLHALTFECGNGTNLLLHVGIDTVSLKGLGFTPLVSVGDKVNAGQKVMEVNLDTIKAAGLSSMVITVVCKD